MNNFKVEFKQLYKSYNKQLKKLHKENFSDFNINIDYFIIYLKFLRDYTILTENLVLDNGEENLKIASLATALAEYEKFQTCNNFCCTIKESTAENEALLDKYLKEKAFHWDNF
jgi:hypothetical protein